MDQAAMDALKKRLMDQLTSSYFESVDDVGPNEIGVSTPHADFILVIEPV